MCKVGRPLLPPRRTRREDVAANDEEGVSYNKNRETELVREHEGRGERRNASCFRRITAKYYMFPNAGLNQHSTKGTRQSQE